MTERERNQQIAEAICQDLQWNNQSFRVGQWIAVLNGKVIAVDDHPNQVLKILRATEPGPARGMIVEVTAPVVDVIR